MVSKEQVGVYNMLRRFWLDRKINTIDGSLESLTFL